MRQPLPVARSCIASDDGALKIRKIEAEAGIPDTLVLRLGTIERCHLLGGTAEASGADIRAIAATEATLSNLRPMRMLRVFLQKILDALKGD